MFVDNVNTFDGDPNTPTHATTVLILSTNMKHCGF